MPGDMTVQEPGPRVVYPQSDGEIALGGEDGGVAAWRIDGLEGVGPPVPGPALLCQDPEVVAVQMDGVRDAARAAVSLYRRE